MVWPLFSALQPDVDHEVGGVSRGGQHASSARVFVHGTLVLGVVLLEARVDALQQNHAHLLEQLAWLAFHQEPLLTVVGSSLQEQSVYVSPIFRRFGEHVHIHWQSPRLVLESVDGQLILPGLDLHHRRHEALREEQCRQPLRFGRSFRHPLVEKRQALKQVLLPGRQRLQTGLLLPRQRNLPQQHRHLHGFQSR